MQGGSSAGSSSRPAVSLKAREAALMSQSLGSLKNVAMLCFMMWMSGSQVGPLALPSRPMRASWGGGGCFPPGLPPPGLLPSDGDLQRGVLPACPPALPACGTRPWHSALQLSLALVPPPCSCTSSPS